MATPLSKDVEDCKHRISWCGTCGNQTSMDSTEGFHLNILICAGKGCWRQDGRDGGWPISNKGAEYIWTPMRRIGIVLTKRQVLQENDKDDDDDKVDQSDKDGNAIMTQRKKWKLLEVHEIVFQRPSQPRLNLKATNVWGKKRVGHYFHRCHQSLWIV